MPSSDLKVRRSVSAEPVSGDVSSLLSEKDRKILELEALIQTISRGKYMWESTFDAITNPVMIISSDYRIQRANRAAAEAARMDVRQMIRSTCHEVLADSPTPCRGCPLPKTLDQRMPHDQILDPFKKSARHYQVNAYPLVSEKGEAQAVLYYRDVTEEKELQRQLLHSEKMAAIGTLAGGVAHEINNPLGGILAFAQLAMRDLPEGHNSQKDLKEIEDAALRCKKIVQDLLDFSRQNREEVFGPVQLNEVIRRIMPLIQVQARTSRIEVVFDLNDSVPTIRGSFHKLQQVFLNLVTNAYQAMGQGGRLTLKTFQNAEGQVAVAVSDTGPGISDEHIEKIFDPYFTTKRQGEGTGLGLSITYGIVREHEGTIQVESTEGRGATFNLAFPVMSKA